MSFFSSAWYTPAAVATELRSRGLNMGQRGPKRAIILAAGMGSRLVAHDSSPKPLKSVAGVPLLVRILRTLQSEGIRDAVIVTGHRGDEIKRTLLA